jgi:hypothetical protein
LDINGFSIGWVVDDVMMYNCGAPPANDNFAAASTVTLAGAPASYSITGSNAGASLEVLEHAASCEGAFNIGSTVWYKYTATADQNLTFSLTGSSLIKSLSIWTGGTLGLEDEVACSPPAINTAVSLTVNNGTTYYIRVGSASAIGGSFTLQVGPPPTNDAFANAIDITNGFQPYANTSDVIGATIETGDPISTCAGVPNFRTVWFKYLSLGNNTLSLNTTGSGYDTVLSVWAGTGLGSLFQLGCNDNTSIAVTTSSLTLNTLPGGLYYIRVASRGGTLTDLHFNMSVASVTGSAPLRNYFSTATPTLTWNRVTDATQYEIQISKTNTFATLVGTTTLVPSSQLSYQTPSLEEGFYYYRVRALRGAIVTAWSTDSFTIDLP